MITYRRATPDDIHPAFELALRVFVEYEAPEYGKGAIEKFKADCTANDEYIKNYESGKYMMFIARDGEKIVGIVNERGNGRISMLFVDSAYHRQGIATVLMEQIVCELKLSGINKITLHSSPYAVPFYKNFGFTVTGMEQEIDCFIVTPMEYTPNEIWDVLDANGNKTERFHERGRPMATGDYHLVVHVWKHNGRGEWLIDRRATNRGTSIDGKWETTGGAAIAGDDSLTAALREAKEELGLNLDPKKGILFHRTPRHGDDGRKWFQEAWVFEHDCPIEAVYFQKEETCDAMWASADKIREMMAAGEFLSEWFYPYIDEMFEKWGRRNEVK